MYEVTARLRVRGGELEGFKRQAAQIMKATRELDTKTVRYDWFLSEDGGECVVREAYVDADSLLKHQQQIAEAKMKLFRAFVAGHTMTFYSEPSPALSQLLSSLGATFTVFSLLQSLDVDIEVREEVRA